MTWLADTNVLVCRYDHRFADKQRKATTLLRGGIEHGDGRLCWQTLVEFGGLGSRPLRPDGHRLFDRPALLQEIDALTQQFPVLWPDAEVLRQATRGAALYQLPWLDAVIWAHAERWGCEVLYSEDFQHGRRYGSVKVVNPFA
jgi:predicted nucleic acid-binding protein